MKKIKYFYNTYTMRYEKLVTPLRVKLLRIFGFIAVIIFSSYLVITLAQRYFPSTAERRLKQENEDLKYAYQVLEAQVGELEERMASLETRDNEVYRAFFESQPIPDSFRAKTVQDLAALKKITKLSENQLIASVGNTLNRLYNRMLFQQNSLMKIKALIESKGDLLAAIPAIQPVSNKQLERVASGFGYRIDPIYKIPKMHTGLDFTASTGTPIYATADGVVSESGFNTGGFGNHVVIDHGFGYETLYAHMVRIKAKIGQKVKRGEVIGWVGSTGKSTGPHLHYEVHKNGIPVDPIYFFYNDLSPEAYDRLLKLAATRNQSFD